MAGFGFWQLNLSTAQNDFSKFRPGWWQFCWITGVKFNSIHSILVRFLNITQFILCLRRRIWQFLLPIHHDVSSDRAWWLPFREPCVSCQSPASAGSGLGSPGDSRSHSGHVGNTPRRRLITCCLLWPAARRFWLGLHLATAPWSWRSLHFSLYIFIT